MTEPDGMMASNIKDNVDGVWGGYEAFELYVFSLYWIFQVLTTVGYGDFSGSGTIREMLFSIFLEFGGLLLFATLTGLLTELVSIGATFQETLEEYVFGVNVWILRLEKANDNKRIKGMPAEMYQSISLYTEEAYEHDFNLIIESADFYQQLKPQDQTLLIKTLFSNFRRNFRNFFDPCE